MTDYITTLSGAADWTVKMRFVFFLATAYLALPACSVVSSDKPDVHQYFDELTGANIASLVKPIVFYNELRWISANTRDYVYLGPLEVNRSGNRNFFIWLGFWSTIDRFLVPPEPSDFRTLYLLADDEPMELSISSLPGSELGITEPPYATPVGNEFEGYYVVTRDQIRILALAKRIVVRSSPETGTGTEYQAIQKNNRSLANYSSYMFGE